MFFNVFKVSLALALSLVFSTSLSATVLKNSKGECIYGWSQAGCMPAPGEVKVSDNWSEREGITNKFGSSKPVAKAPTKSGVKSTKGMSAYGACEAGNALACADLGDLYREGDKRKKIKRDMKRAINYYTKACLMDEAASCATLGYIYEEGDGARKDLAIAYSFYQRACEEGFSASCEDASKLKEYAAKDVLPSTVEILHEARGEDWEIVVFLDTSKGAVLRIKDLYSKRTDNIEVEVESNDKETIYSGRLDGSSLDLIVREKNACKLGSGYFKGQAILMLGAQQSIGCLMR